MSVRSFQQIVDDVADKSYTARYDAAKPYMARYVGPDTEYCGFTLGKVYEVQYESPTKSFVELVDDDGCDRCRPADEFEKVE